MNLIKEWDEASAYTFFKDKTKEEVETEIDNFGSDRDVLDHYVNKKYPSEIYFVLIDYVDDGNIGYFNIRVWEKNEPSLLREELIGLCEDNEVMKEAINEHFENKYKLNEVKKE